MVFSVITVTTDSRYTGYQKYTASPTKYYVSATIALTLLFHLTYHKHRLYRPIIFLKNK